MFSICRASFTAIIAGLLLATTVQAECAAPVPVPLSEALRKETLRLETNGNGREQLRLLFTNGSKGEIRILVPAGVIFRAGNGDRVVTLRQAEINVPGNGSAEAEIPAAALSSRNASGTQPFSVIAESEQKLAGFLKSLATHDDIPRATSQLVVLALLENITFAQWEQFLAPVRVSGSNIIQAIDALWLLKELEPGENFALARDNELKLRALRNPVARPKAAQLYGLALPDEPIAAGKGVPSLKQLLHTQPGDNCPTCQMRERAGRGAGDF